MRWFRGLGRLLGYALLVALLAPSLAAWPSAFLDRGPDGPARVSALPMALAAFDPLVWTCSRNSVLVASVVAGVSMGIGVGLGWIVGSRRFRGRGLLWALAIAPMAAGPLLIAPSLVSALGGRSGWGWPAGRSSFGVPFEDLFRWLALVWTGLAWGVPLVAMATLAGLRRVDPAWTEAALAFGASRRRAWWDVTWPTLRPGVARASAMVFTLALVEPAGPMVLGLRRTLAVQVIEAAGRLEQPTRSATLAVIAIAIAATARALIVRWGGRSYATIDHSDVHPTPIAGFRRASASRLVLLAWCALASGPLGSWLWQGFEAARAGPGPDDPWSSLFDPESRAWLANSATTAGLAVAVDLAILTALMGRAIGPGGRPGRLASRIFEAVPPLAIGVGALATPWLLLVLADLGDGPPSHWLRAISIELSPGRSPGVLLILALAAGQWPMLAGQAGLARAMTRPARVEAARLMGASDRRAVRIGEGRRLGAVPVAPALLAFAMASTSLAPAILLTPYSERKTLAPGVLGLVMESDGLGPREAGPVAVLLAVNLLAMVIASRSRSSPIRPDF